MTIGAIQEFHARLNPYAVAWSSPKIRKKRIFSLVPFGTWRIAVSTLRSLAAFSLELSGFDLRHCILAAFRAFRDFFLVPLQG